MNTPAQKIPGPDHPIAIGRDPVRVVVRLKDKVVAYSADPLILQEAGYPPVYYIPRRDVDMALLERSEHKTYCPYKGEASYFSIPYGSERSVNAVWSYESPYEAVAEIREHLAFYPDRVDSIEVITARRLEAANFPQQSDRRLPSIEIPRFQAEQGPLSFL